MSDRVTSFLELVERRTGIRLSSSLARRVTALIENRTSAAAFSDADTYLRHLEEPDGADEFERLLNVLTVGKTSLWRYPEQMRALAEHVVPLLDQVLPRGESINLWSAASATGEEPYTMATALAAAGWLERRNARVLGTDINTEFLAFARNGRYRLAAGAFASLPTPARAMLCPDDGHFVVHPRIAERVSFARLNLVADPYPAPGSWHVVICANVLIYFSPQTVQQVVDRLIAAMAPVGVFFVGAAESLPRSSHNLTVIRIGNVFGYARGDWGRLLSPFVVLPEARGKQKQGAAARLAQPPAQGRSAVPPPAVRAREATAGSRAPAPEWNNAVAAGQAVGRLGLERELQQIRRTASAGERAAAVVALARLQAEFPDSSEAIHLKAVLLFEERRFEEAQDALQDAIETDPLAFDLYFYLGWIHRQRGDLAEAQTAYRKALFLEPAFAFARYEFALILHQSGDFDAAAFEYARAEKDAGDQSVKSRLVARAQSVGDAFWNNTRVVVELSQRNRILALHHCEPAGAVSRQTAPAEKPVSG